MSLLLCGSQDLHVELRARAVCDMVLWKDFYTSGGAIPPQEVAPMEIVKKIAAICASFKEGQNLNDYHTVQNIFQDECIAATKPGTYSSMWHIQALSSSLGCVIHSIYPNTAPVIRPILNTAVYPRVPASSEVATYTIMWTRTQPMPGSQSWWSPNHFVACVPHHLVQDAVARGNYGRAAYSDPSNRTDPISSNSKVFKRSLTLPTTESCTKKSKQSVLPISSQPTTMKQPPHLMASFKKQSSLSGILHIISLCVFKCIDMICMS